MNKKNIIIITLLIVIAVIFAAGIILLPPVSFVGSGASDPDKDEPIVERPVSLSISCVGDVMVHSPQLRAQYDATSGTYNFDNNFEFVSKYISKADLALCNIETTFAGEPYSGYPLFNCPDQLAEALKTAGFDVAITANNHMLDKGVNGLRRTLEVLRQTGFYTVGSQFEGEAPYALAEVSGVKIGIVAYTYETTGSAGGNATINGNPVSQEAKDLINSFNYHDIENDLGKIAENMNTLRNNGAEIVICYMHWGEEYKRIPNIHQTSIAQRLADAGADIIFASHPHVLQEATVVTRSSSGNVVPVFYSMGNFISNQRSETLNNRFTEQGMIANVELEYMKSTREIKSIRMKVIPTWVDKSMTDRTNYQIIPLDDELVSNPRLSISGHMNRAVQALEDVRSLIGDEYLKGCIVLATEDEQELTDEAIGQN